MNLGESKTKAIQYIKSYSNDGQLTTAGENQDYLLVMPTYANTAQKEISVIVGINASYTITQTGTAEEGLNKYPLPTNYRRLIKVNLKDMPFFNYKIENGQFVVPKSVDGTIELLYYKNPANIDNTTPDSYEFEVDDIAQEAIPFFMGGMAISDENPNISDKLLNIYYEKKNQLTAKEDNYPQGVVTVYSAGW